MPKRRPVQKQKRSPFFPVLGILVGVGLVLAASGFTFAATQESHDGFCASCHTQPESTFYQRSLGAQPVDLASAHVPKAVRCIDCHSGSGLAGRVQAEMLGARNALKWYSGTAVQPAALTFPIGDDNCLKCHQQVTTGSERDNHFHDFLARWQAADPNAATCTSCHSSHTTDGDVERYLNRARTEAVCEACHRVMGQGD